MKKADRIQINTVISLTFPVQSFTITYERIPNMMPSEMLDAHTMKMIVRKAGSASVKS